MAIHVLIYLFPSFCFLVWLGSYSFPYINCWRQLLTCRLWTSSRSEVELLPSFLKERSWLQRITKWCECSSVNSFWIWHNVLDKMFLIFSLFTIIQLESDDAGCYFRNFELDQYLYLHFSSMLIIWLLCKFPFYDE